MKRTSPENYKNIFIFISILFVFGIFTGILFYFKQDSGSKDQIILSLNGLFQNNVFSFETCIYHFLALLIISTTLFCFMGIVLLILYIFLEGISIGFLVPIFFRIYKLNAIWYFSVYFILIKFIYIILLFLLFIKFFYFLKNYLKCLKNKSYNFLKSIKYIIIFLILILLNDCFVYFIGNKFIITLLN